MSVHPERLDEYRRRHNPIWEELARTLRAHGAHNYSIFHDPQTHLLFCYVELEDEARWAAIAQTEVCQRWWKDMREFMPSHADNSPVSRSAQEIFHLD